MILSSGVPVPSVRAVLRQLRVSRARFDARAAAVCRDALDRISGTPLRTVRQLLDYHDDLLFLCAFPHSLESRRAAIQQLNTFALRWRGLREIQRRAAGSGIAGTVSRPPISWPVAEAWIPQEDIDIEWDDLTDASAFDALVGELLGVVERESYESGDYTTREWIALASRPGERAAAWLVREASTRTPPRFLEAWDAAQVPLRWALGDSPRSTTHARHRLTPVLRQSFRRLEQPLAAHVAIPLEDVRLLTPARAAPIIELARSALAVRGREVHAMNHPNGAEVYLVDLGEGVRLALIGVAPEQRLSLEANYGYLLMSNGVPIGYGGVSPLYRQANTGINVFDAFRGSEATFLWGQTLRAFRSLFGVRRFVINGYQFGAGNSEAIASGAYWFYYRLGFRPGLAEDADLAEQEAARLRRHPATRTSAAVLRRLARGDLHLDLADFDASDYFEESLLSRIGAVVARRIAASAAPSHRDGEAALVDDTVRALGIGRVPAVARRTLARLAPVAALLDLERWSEAERRSLGAWLQLKGDAQERDFALGATKQSRFFRELQSGVSSEGQ